MKSWLLHFLKTSVTPLINQHHLYQRYMYVRCASIMINAKCFFVSLVEVQSDKKSKKNKWYRPWLDHATGRQRPARPLPVWEHLPMCFFPPPSPPLWRVLPVWVGQRGWRRAAVRRSEASETDGLSGTTPKISKIGITLNAVVIFFLCGLSSQLAYQAWVSSVKQALRERQRRQKQMKRAIKGEREAKEASRKETFPTAASSGSCSSLWGDTSRGRRWRKGKQTLKKSVEPFIHEFKKYDFYTLSNGMHKLCLTNHVAWASHQK